MSFRIAFKAEHEKAVDEAGLDGYELRVQFPVYSDDVGEMSKIRKWSQASEWPARFRILMPCERSSLRRVVD